MPSMQETFDVVVNHLRKQGAKALQFVEDDTYCSYRGDDGMKCAVGFLIPDESYDQAMEGLTAEDTGVRELLEKLGHDPKLCKALQMVHDVYEPQPWSPGVKTWETEFKNVALAFGLEYKRPLSEVI